MAIHYTSGARHIYLSNTAACFTQESTYQRITFFHVKQQRHVFMLKKHFIFSEHFLRAPLSNWVFNLFRSHKTHFFKKISRIQWA